MIALICTSCATQASFHLEETTQSYSEASSRNLEPIVSAIAIPMVVDIKVTGKRIIYEETESFKGITVTDAIKAYGNSFSTEGIAAFKRIALAKAASAHNVDIIVGACFDVSTTPDNHFSIKVAGYPAVYTNFRNATKADSDLLKEMKQYVPEQGCDPLLNIPTTTLHTKQTIVQQ